MSCGHLSQVVYEIAQSNLARLDQRHQVGWMDGGCLIFAQALASAFGGSVGAIMQGAAQQGHPAQAEHAVMCIELHGEPWVIDAKGARPADRALSLWRQEYARPGIAEFHWQTEVSMGPPHNDFLVDVELSASIAAHLLAHPDIVASGGDWKKLLPPPDLLTEEDFLCGAEFAEPWLDQHFDDYVRDINRRYDPDELRHLGGGYALAPSRDSMLLLHFPGGDAKAILVGYYNPPGAVCIKDEHQGQGLGAELILATYLWLGNPPTEALDEQAFTEAGLAAHRSAYWLGVERGIFDPRPTKPAARLRP